MDYFHSIDGVLHAEEVALPDIAHAVGTPFYCYSSATFARHYRVFVEAFDASQPLVCYSVKANSNVAILSLLGSLGSGGDCVSEGEIRRCLAAGIAAQKIVFSGVGKTAEEMRFALENNILLFNVESESELRLLNDVALSMGIQAPVALRVNPDVDAATHHKISTGRKTDKFGIAWEHAPAMYHLAAELKGIAVKGLDVHIGSQLTSLAPFEQAFAKVVELVHRLRQDGLSIDYLDLGGGLGIPYSDEEPPSPQRYAELVQRHTKDLGCQLIFEPGRMIAGNAGILVSRVVHTKDVDGHHFLVVDAGMNDLVRPAMYDAHHDIIPVLTPKKGTKELAMDVVGPICESGDTFAKQRTLPVMTAGDLVAFRSAGAYGAVMANTYNSRPLVPEILVQGEHFAEIRKRQSYEAMLHQDVIPAWLR